MFSIIPSNGNLQLAEHRDGPGGIEQRDLLRRADDHRAGQRQALRQGQRDVAGPGRQVNDQVVERPPVHLVEELLHDPVEHRPPHDDGLFGLEQEAHRHELRPWVSIGWIRSPRAIGRPVAPTRWGIEGP